MDTSERSGGGRLNAAVTAEIRAELARRRWSQVDLANRLGEDQMWLSRRLRGTKPLSLTEFEAIAEALSITPAELVGRAVRGMAQTTAEYFAQTIRPRDTRPSGGPKTPGISARPNVAPGVRRSRVIGTPLAVAALAQTA